MQANVKERHPPTGHPSCGRDHTPKSFCGTALLVARRSTRNQVGLLPPVALKVSHFFSFGKDCRYPDGSAAESTPGETTRQ
jgi:hypothetical protein